MYEANQIIAGRYRILKKIGSGGFSSIWLAQSLSLNKSVVIKILGGDIDEVSVQFFQQEAQVLTRIRNPHVGELIEFGQLDDGRPYLVLEYVDGASLANVLMRGPLPIKCALIVAEAIADGLSAAHAIGVIHRDLKPSNIIVPEADGVYLFERAKLIDFGVRGEIRASTGTTKAGELFGTPKYMSPEQMRAEEQSPATDVYGLGVVIYEMIFGTTPFSADGFFETITKTLGEEVDFPAFPVIPDSIRDLMRRCLSKKAKDRPQNGSALLAEICWASHQLKEADLPPPVLLKASPNELAYREVPTLACEPLPPKSSKKSRAIDAGSATAMPCKTLPPKSSKKSSLLALLLVAALTVGIGLLTFYSFSPISRHLTFVFVGIIISAVGVGMWFWVRSWLNARKSEVHREAEDILLGSKSLDALTQSLAIEVDAIIARVNQVDERIMAHTLAMMVKEYECAKESKDRQSALINAVSILEKLNTKLSPWYVRYDKFVAFVVSSLGVVSGLVTIVINIIKIKKGTP